MVFMTFEQRKNTKALAWTLGVHVLLFIIFVVFRYTLPVQIPVEDLGMEVNLGTSEQGFGMDQPELTEAPAAVQSALQAQARSAAAAQHTDINTAIDEDAPAVHLAAKPEKKKNDRDLANNKNKKATAQQNTRQRTPQATQSARYVYPGAIGKGGNSAQNNKPGGNEGIGQGEGDMGVPGGTPDATAYSGVPGGGGTSIGHSISGRTIISRPDPKAEFREGGKVVIRVTVNREGQITNSRVISAANATIRALALKKMQSVRFNQSSSAPAEQFGNITFDFKATRK